MTFLAWLCFTGHESTSIYRHDKKSSYNNAKDLTGPERGRKLNVKAASFLFNSPHCVHIWRGSRAGEEPYAQDTQGEGSTSAQPLRYFFYTTRFSVYFCFLSCRIKYTIASPIDIILLSQVLQAQHRTGHNGASQPQE